MKINKFLLSHEYLNMSKVPGFYQFFYSSDFEVAPCPETREVPGPEWDAQPPCRRVPTETWRRQSTGRAGAWGRVRGQAGLPVRTLPSPHRDSRVLLRPRRLQRPRITVSSLLLSGRITGLTIDVLLWNTFAQFSV